MSAALSMLVVAVCAIGLVLWYLRRPPERRLRVASWRFLGTLSPASQSPLRPSFRNLVRSPWLAIRLLAFLLMAAPFLLDAHDPTPAGRPRIALRLVLDVSASMEVEGPEGTRMAEARRLVRQLLAKVEAYRSQVDVCVTATLVDAQAHEVAADDDAQFDAEAAKRRAPVGAAGTQLVAQAFVKDLPRCQPTHVVVISDLAKPSLDAGDDGRTILWWQVGAPRPNIGLGDVTVDTTPLAAGAPTISVAVRRVGGARAPGAVRVIGPDRTRLPVRLPDWNVPDELVALSFEAPTAGRYVVELERAGAFSGDDRLTIDVPSTSTPSFDWRLADIPRPALLRQGSGPDSVLVAPVAMLTQATGRRAVLTLGPLEVRSRGPRLGLFVSDDPLLADLNLEMIDRSAPSGIALPGSGWIRVVIEESQDASHAGVLIARRVDPPAAIVPLPPKTGPEELMNAGYLLLFNAIRYVVQDFRPTLRVRRTAADDSEIPDADLETDTAVAVSNADRQVAITPAVSAKPPTGRPFWPWLVVGLLMVLIAERWFGVRRGNAP
jgi:hypothetical protein